MRYRLMVSCLSLLHDEHSQQVTETSVLLLSLSSHCPLPLARDLSRPARPAECVACSAGCCIWSCLHIKYTHYVYALAKLPLIEQQLAMGRIYWAKFQYTVSIQYSQKDTNLLANQLLWLRTGRDSPWQCHENANRKLRRPTFPWKIIRFLCQHLKHLNFSTFAALTLSYFFLIRPIAGIKRFIKIPHNWLGKQRVKWEMGNEECQLNDSENDFHGKLLFSLAFCFLI